MFSLEIVSLILILIINAMIVWIIGSQGWRTVGNRYFIFAALFVILWALGTIGLIAGNTVLLTEIGLRTWLVAPMYTVIFLSLFGATFPDHKGKTFTPINLLFLGITVPYSVFLLFSPSTLVPAILMDAQFNKITVDFLQFTLYTIYFNFAFSVTFSQYIFRIPKHKGHQRQQMIYVLAGTMLAAAFSLVTNLVMPLFGITEYIWLGPTWTLFYVITVSISIVRHQLFDIKLAAVRSAAYILALGVLAAVYYFLAYIVSVTLFQSQTTAAVSISPINIILALVLAFMFQPIKHFFDQLTDSIFYRDIYKTDDFFARMSELLGSTTDLRGLLERASHEIASTLKAEQAVFFLYYNNAVQHHMSAGTPGHSRMPILDAHGLDAFFKDDTKGIIVTDKLDEQSSVRRMLVSHKIALVMPLRYSNSLIGYVLLGEQQRSGGYTQRDLRVLNTIADELVIAIQNALSVHAVKEINAHLQQRIDVATKELRSSNSQLRHLDEVKDEFMSMASHQLRTPLTSIKGYLSMVLEEDMGKITPQQRTVLNEAFNSSERMVRLIADFLNVSRLQTGKFVIEKNAIDIASVVQGEVGSLKMIASTHDMKLEFRTPESEVVLMIDEAKIRQVIMNFIDNAIYYSRPKSTILVTLETVNNELLFKVIDTGIGVPQAEQAMLFNKFFRAKNARQQRPDGTGVGLYLAKKVITAHGGKMIFSSVEGQGSTFGFSLPVDHTHVSTTGQ